MPLLEIHHVDGTVDQRELSRAQSLTIGKQPFNDLSIPEEGVAPLHCRVLWNKTTFEVTAATSMGVEVNGTPVTQARLQPGDIIRVGSLDLIYRDESAPEQSDDAAQGYHLRNEIDQETPRANPRNSAKPSPPPKSGNDPKSAPRSDRNRHRPEPVDEMSLFEGKVYTESQAIRAYDAGELEDEPDEFTAPIKLKPLATSISSGSRQPEAVPEPYRPAMLSSAARARPGEQDIFRSPLVLGLSLSGLVLVLVTGIFWFLIGREQAARLYDRAVAELNDGQYAQSIASFEQFLQQYSGHSLHKQAERGLGRALVQKEIAGASPAWQRGLEQLQALISRHRNETDFTEMHPIVHRFAEEISLGAARTAELTRDASLLTVSEDAQVVLERYADPSAAPTAAISRIKEARVAAVIAISKQKIFDDGMAAVDAALAAKQPMVALSEREKLVRAYDGFASHQRIKETLQKALDLERSVIVSDNTERPAETTDFPPPDRQPVLGLFHTRTRTDEASQGRVAFVMAKDCCYAVDTVTGELAWRRVVGFNSPFFPKTTSGAVPGLLVYDGNHRSLVCCQPATGKLIWRQKLDGRPRSAPFIHEGQIYVPTDDRALCRIDLETGRLNERVTFSQNIHGPPTLSPDGNHLLVPGEMAMIYALSLRPLAAAATTFTDHAAGSLSAPPLALGKLLLLCENDKSDSANLRLWDVSNPKAPLVELSSKAVRVRGQVRETPVLRGNQLVVPSSGEQLAAFSVTDEAGREGLAPVAQYRIREDEDIEKRKGVAPGSKKDDGPLPPPAALPAGRVPLYVALGADRQFWAASSAFRRFEIGADSIHMDSNSLALGIASQQLQLIGDQFYVGRKAPFHDAVVFSAIDRERMVSPWRTVTGNRFLELTAARDGGVVGISEAGQIVSIGLDRLRQGGFDLRSSVELELPGQLQQQLTTSSLHDGRMFLAASGNVTQLYVIGQSGQIDFNGRLDQKDIVQAGAVLLDEGLIVPLAGRLKLIPLGSGRKSVQDWLAPVGDKPTPPWKFLLRLDTDEVLTCHAGGLLTRIQVRMTDVPHLAEAAKIQLDHPVDIAPVQREDSILVAEADGSVRQLNWRTFDREGLRTMAAPVRGAWSIGSSWLVWSGDSKLQLVAEGRDLPVQWTFALNDLEPVGAPIEENNQLWIACRNGTVVVIDPKQGHEIGRRQIPQALTMGLKRLDGSLFAVACDGALYRLDAVAGQ